jgi:hypothetical protein
MLGSGPRALRIGRHVRFRPKDVSEWLERCAQTESANGQHATVAEKDRKCQTF